SITSLRRVTTTTKPCLQNWKLETNNANYVDSNRSQTKWVIPLSRPPLNLQFLERGRLDSPNREGESRRRRQGGAHTASRMGVERYRVRMKEYFGSAARHSASGAPISFRTMFVPRTSDTHL